MARLVDDRRSADLEKRLCKRRYELPDIDGYTLTYHAAIRMVARQIEIDWVREALTKPSRPGHPSGRNGTRKYVGDLAMCVVNPENRRIVTVGYGVLNAPAD